MSHSPTLAKVLQLASQKSAILGTPDVGIPSLLVAVADDVSPNTHRLLAEAGLNAQLIQLTATNLYGCGQNETAQTLTQVPLSREAQTLLSNASEQATRLVHIATTPTHVLHQLVRHRDGVRILKAAFLVVCRSDTTTTATIVQRLERLLTNVEAAVTTNIEGLPAGEAKVAHLLDQMTVDLTKLAREGKLPTVVGRKTEIRRAIQILGRLNKNNPVLIGEAGVGKTAIAEGLAIEIVAGRVPETLQNKRLLRLDLTALIAGTQFRGEFEQRLKAIMDELNKRNDSLLFIDELHTLVGAGAARGSTDASNLLKPALARGELTIIGATTIDEYRKHIETDAAFVRRFQPIMVEPSTVEDTIQIILERKTILENHHGVSISHEAIVQAATMADRYIADRHLPDKAIDVVDEAASALAIDEPSGNVTVEIISSMISQMTGIKVDQLAMQECARLVNMESELGKRVIGQHPAISALSRSVRRARSGLKDDKSPIGSFLFLGPTGVGKTEVCKALQEFLFDSDRQIIRLDMSEYMEKHNVSRMIGAPPGYVGYEEGGRLTEAVRRRPYSVVLLDEIEKAHSDVFNVLLQVLDDGRLTDGLGRTVDFRNTVIIMTSNIASSLITDTLTKLGDRCSQEILLEAAMPQVKRIFNPEFLNRLDEIVCFGQLSRPDLMTVLGLQLADLSDRLERQHGMSIELDDRSREFVLSQGYNREFGARPMKRAVRRLVEDPLADKLIRGEFERGALVSASVEGNALVFHSTRCR